jgi:16S rRNA processing protein RimM
MAVRAGRVGRPHGLDGSFHVMSPVASLLVVGTVLGDDLGEIVVRKGTDEKPIVRVSSASDREAAEALRGRWLPVPAAEPEPLGEDEYAAADLEGCQVVDGDVALGVVSRLLALPSVEALELDDGTLVPLVRDCVRSVDVAAKRIDIDRGFLGAA